MAAAVQTRSCPVCGGKVSSSLACCASCRDKLSKDQRKEIGRSWHRIRSGQTSLAVESAFADQLREAVRTSVATKGGWRW